MADDFGHHVLHISDDNEEIVVYTNSELFHQKVPSICQFFLGIDKRILEHEGVIRKYVVLFAGDQVLENSATRVFDLVEIFLEGFLHFSQKFREFFENKVTKRCV